MKYFKHMLAILPSVLSKILVREMCVELKNHKYEATSKSSV